MPHGLYILFTTDTVHNHKYKWRYLISSVVRLGFPFKYNLKTLERFFKVVLGGKTLQKFHTTNKIFGHSRDNKTPSYSGINAIIIM